jgi:phosphatidylglycerophosphate synthase
VYALAAITDFFDGYIARKQGLVSVLGKFLDPLADKLFVMATLVWLVNMGRIETWVVVALLAREFGITGLRSIASSEGVVIAAGDDGKAKTALQMIGILCLILGYPYTLHLGFHDLGRVDLARLLVHERRLVRAAVRRRRRGEGPTHVVVIRREPRRPAPDHRGSIRTMPSPENITSPRWPAGASPGVSARGNSRPIHPST